MAATSCSAALAARTASDTSAAVARAFVLSLPTRAFSRVTSAATTSSRLCVSAICGHSDDERSAAGKQTGRQHAAWNPIRLRPPISTEDDLLLGRLPLLQAGLLGGQRFQPLRLAHVRRVVRKQQLQLSQRRLRLRHHLEHLPPAHQHLWWHPPLHCAGSS